MKKMKKRKRRSRNGNRRGRRGNEEDGIDSEGYAEEETKKRMKRRG